MLVTPIKVQLGPLANGLVIGESFVRAPPFEFPGVADLFKRYQAKGDVAFGKDGEWAKSRQLFTQFQNVAPNDLEQFRTGSKQVILWPAEYKTGNMIYPYGEARKK
jgi:branched-chain amino acid transport system substrate-binding protein